MYCKLVSMWWSVGWFSIAELSKSCGINKRHVCLWQLKCRIDLLIVSFLFHWHLVLLSLTKAENGSKATLKTEMHAFLVTFASIPSTSWISTVWFRFSSRVSASSDHGNNTSPATGKWKTYIDRFGRTCWISYNAGIKWERHIESM